MQLIYQVEPPSVCYPLWEHARHPDVTKLYLELVRRIVLNFRRRIAAEPFAASKELLVDEDAKDLKDLGEHLVTILADQGWDDDKKSFNDDLTLEQARGLLEKLEQLAAALGGFHAVQEDADILIMSE